jgi:hypothetical protein
VAKATITVGRALLVASLTPLLLRARPTTLARVLEPRRRTREPDPATTAEMIKLTDVALHRGRPLVRSGCLSRSVTRYWMLRRVGEDVSLCFGVGTIDGEIEAHCWLSRDDHPILEPTRVAAFHEMYRICEPGIVVTR